MTLILDNFSGLNRPGSMPKGVGIKTRSDILGDEAAFTVEIGSKTLTMTDFFHIVEQALTATPLEPIDPRKVFVARVSSMKEIKGYNRHDPKDVKRLIIKADTPYPIEGFAKKAAVIGPYKLSMIDLLGAAEYVLTNTNLAPVTSDKPDPRRNFIANVRAAIIVPELFYYKFPEHVDLRSGTFPKMYSR